MPPMLSRTTRAELKLRRVAAGLSQRQLAGRVGVTQQTVWQWESSGQVPAPRHVPKLAKSLGLTQLELAGLLNNNKRKQERVS
jgi:transcriptional regulator with XRE-family HTH domain